MTVTWRTPCLHLPTAGELAGSGQAAALSEQPHPADAEFVSIRQGVLGRIPETCPQCVEVVCMLSVCGDVVHAFAHQ